MSYTIVSPYGSDQGAYDAKNEPNNWQELERKTGMNIMKLGEKAFKDLLQNCDIKSFELDQDADDDQASDDNA